MKADRKDLVTKRHVRQALEKPFQVAGLMSNVCFNLKHKAKLDNNDREMLAKMQEDWDKVKSVPAWMRKKEKGSGAFG